MRKHRPCGLCLVPTAVKRGKNNGWAGPGACWCPRARSATPTDRLDCASYSYHPTQTSPRTARSVCPRTPWTQWNFNRFRSIFGVRIVGRFVTLTRRFFVRIPKPLCNDQCQCGARAHQQHATGSGSPRSIRTTRLCVRCLFLPTTSSTARVSRFRLGTPVHTKT